MIDPTLAGRSVLIVEDEYLIAAALAEELGDRGAMVLGPAPSVQRALALVAGVAHVDLAVLDVNLRGEDVYPVADVLAERGTPFVLVTGYDRHAVPERYRQRSILEKPIEMETVLTALGRLLE